MKLTPGQKNELDIFLFFLPPQRINSKLKKIKYEDLSEEEIRQHFLSSERGIKTDYKHPRGWNAIEEGKRWTGRMMEMYKEGILDGTMPYRVLLGGYKDEEAMPRNIVDFLKKDMFKGVDVDTIEKNYRDILIEKGLVSNITGKQNMDYKKLLYGSSLKRIAMRFIEIFLLAGLSALFLSPEFEGQIYAVFGTALGAALLKTLRDGVFPKR